MQLLRILQLPAKRYTHQQGQRPTFLPILVSLISQHSTFIQPEHLYAVSFLSHIQSSFFPFKSEPDTPQELHPSFFSPESTPATQHAPPSEFCTLYAEKDFVKHSLINIDILRLLFIPLLQTDTAYTTHIISTIPLKPSEHQQLR